MKAWLIIVPILIAVAAVGATAYYLRESSIMNTAALCRDPNNINSHIYNPTRLRTVKDCITVSGIVDSVRMENDGDYHLWFHVDSQYSNLPNSDNNAVYQGDLLAEIVCGTNAASPQEAVLACDNYTNRIPIPNVDENITVTGPYVLDSIHGWMEVHPVYSLTIS